MKTETEFLIRSIRDLARNASPETIEKTAEVLNQADGMSREILHAKLAALASNVSTRTLLEQLVRQWEQSASNFSGAAIALALLSAAHVHESHRHSPTLDLVWTGPETHAIALRRTDQALLQLIDEARLELLITSFAAYNIPNISAALVSAAERGVAIRICIESPQESEGRMAYNTIRALGSQVASRSKIYIWPVSKRSQTADGKHGMLHAKVAVADGRTMLLSSANLTAYAMNLNMEMGVLIRGGTLPSQVTAHFEELIASGVFQSVER